MAGLSHTKPAGGGSGGGEGRRRSRRRRSCAAQRGCELGGGGVLTEGQRGATAGRWRRLGGCWGRNLRVRKPEQELGRRDGWLDGGGGEVMGRRGGSEGETAQYKEAHSWSGLFQGGGRVGEGGSL